MYTSLLRLSASTGLINEGLLKQMIHLVESPVAAKVIIEVAAVLNNMSTAFESHREMASTPMLHALFALLQVCQLFLEYHSHTSQCI